MNLTVASAGFVTTVQDLGRVGYRASGVSPGGALDRQALRTANLLVGNDDGAAGVEATLGSLRFHFADERVVAWRGGNFDVEVAGRNLPAGRAALLQRGDELHATAPVDGGRAWISISGGIDVSIVLGSRSTDLRSRFGGYDGRALKNGDVLGLHPQPTRAAQIAHRLAQARVANWSAPAEWASTTPRHPFLRIVRGTDWARFATDATSLFLSESFTVTSDSDRMGVRLDGPLLARRDSEEPFSEPVAEGTIQVPPNGHPIVLLGDCQTIGGYPKIAHVITIDLPAAAQLRAGDSVRFGEVTAGEAQRLLIERERDFERFRIGLALQIS